MTREIENLKRFVDFAVCKGLFVSAKAVVEIMNSVAYAECLEENLKTLKQERDEANSKLRLLSKEVK